MTTPELAHYLHLSEKTVIKLAQDSKVPAVLIDKQWRFKRVQIDEWLEQKLAGEIADIADLPDGMKLPLDDLLPDSALITDLHAKDALSVIEELAGRAYLNKWLHDKPWFVGAVVERESLASTAMDGGVAFLHTRQREGNKIARPFIICGRSWQGIQFGAPDGKPTYLFFLLGLKYDKLHLPILGRLARSLRNPATIAKLRALSSTQQIRALLLKEDANVMVAPQSPVVYEETKPKLDKLLRLRTIRRLEAERAKPEELPKEPARKASAKSKAKASAAAAAAAAAPGAPAATAASAAPAARSEGVTPRKPAGTAKAKKPKAD